MRLVLGVVLGLAAATTLAAESVDAGSDAPADDSRFKSEAQSKGLFDSLTKRSVSMTMFETRRCALCEYVIEMVDRKLRANPFIKWKGMQSFVDPEMNAKEAHNVPPTPPDQMPPGVPFPPTFRAPPPSPDDAQVDGESLPDQDTDKSNGIVGSIGTDGRFVQPLPNVEAGAELLDRDTAASDAQHEAAADGMRFLQVGSESHHESGRRAAAQRDVDPDDLDDLDDHMPVTRANGGRHDHDHHDGSDHLDYMLDDHDDYDHDHRLSRSDSGVEQGAVWAATSYDPDHAARAQALSRTKDAAYMARGLSRPRGIFQAFSVSRRSVPLAPLDPTSYQGGVTPLKWDDIKELRELKPKTSWFSLLQEGALRSAADAEAHAVRARELVRAGAEAMRSSSSSSSSAAASAAGDVPEHLRSSFFASAPGSNPEAAIGPAGAAQGLGDASQVFLQAHADALHRAHMEVAMMGKSRAEAALEAEQRVAAAARAADASRHQALARHEALTGVAMRAAADARDQAFATAKAAAASAAAASTSSLSVAGTKAEDASEYKGELGSIPTPAFDSAAEEDARRAREFAKRHPDIVASDKDDPVANAAAQTAKDMKQWRFAEARAFGTTSVPGSDAVAKEMGAHLPTTVLEADSAASTSALDSFGSDAALSRFRSIIDMGLAMPVQMPGAAPPAGGMSVTGGMPQGAAPTGFAANPGAMSMGMAGSGFGGFASDVTSTTLAGLASLGITDPNIVSQLHLPGQLRQQVELTPVEQVLRDQAAAGLAGTSSDPSAGTSAVAAELELQKELVEGSAPRSLADAMASEGTGILAPADPAPGGLPLGAAGPFDTTAAVAGIPLGAMSPIQLRPGVQDERSAGVTSGMRLTAQGMPSAYHRGAHAVTEADMRHLRQQQAEAAASAAAAAHAAQAAQAAHAESARAQAAARARMFHNPALSAPTAGRVERPGLHHAMHGGASPMGVRGFRDALSDIATTAGTDLFSDLDPLSGAAHQHHHHNPALDDAGMAANEGGRAMFVGGVRTPAAAAGTSGLPRFSETSLGRPFGGGNLFSGITSAVNKAAGDIASRVNDARSKLLAIGSKLGGFVDAQTPASSAEGSWPRPPTLKVGLLGHESDWPRHPSRYVWGDTHPAQRQWGSAVNRDGETDNEFSDTLETLLPEPGSEGGSKDSGWRNLQSNPSDPDDERFAARPGDATAEFGTTAGDLALRSSTSATAQRNAGVAGASLPDPASGDYAKLAQLPTIPHKVGPREQYRLMYRMEQHKRYFELYEHVMDALEDVCQGMLPKETSAGCSGLFARADKITDWLLHGYQADEVCIQAAMCRENYFNE